MYLKKKKLISNKNKGKGLAPTRQQDNLQVVGIKDFELLYWFEFIYLWQTGIINIYQE